MAQKDDFRPVCKVTRRIFIQKTLIASAAISVPWLWINRRSWAETSPKDAVLATFKNACQAFNSQNAASLEPLLASDVVLKKIHTVHHPSQFSGRDAVMSYLKKAWTGAPKVTMTFSPYYDANEPAVTFQGPGSSTAVVKGLACWTDNDGDNDNGDLSYEFHFQNTTGAWLISMLSGSYSHHPTTACAPPT